MGTVSKLALAAGRRSAATWILAAAGLMAAFLVPSVPIERQAAMAETTSSRGAPADPADAEVLAVVEGFNRAFAANDPETYFTFIDGDITVLTPSNPYRVEGIDDDREEFEWGLETERSRIGYFQELQPLVRRWGDVALVTYYSRGSYAPDQRVAYLKETDVLVKRADGWKIVHIHVSGTS